MGLDTNSEKPADCGREKILSRPYVGTEFPSQSSSGEDYDGIRRRSVVGLGSSHFFSSRRKK